MSLLGESELDTLCSEAVSRLNQLKINFLAIDFDLTMIDVHTGGIWKGTSMELASHVRPILKQLVTEAAVNGGIKVAIVTFSPQVRNISDVLKATFPDFYDRIPIRGRDKSWTYDGGGSREGKQAYMASAAEELGSFFPGEDFTKNSTLLIDDDANNIKIALKDGVRAIWLHPGKPCDLLENIRTLT